MFLVELKFCYLVHPYLVTMEMLLMSVLLQFNGSDILSYQELRDSCQIPRKELAKQIQLLLDSKILEMEAGLSFLFGVHIHVIILEHVLVFS